MFTVMELMVKVALRKIIIIQDKIFRKNNCKKFMEIKKNKEIIIIK